MLQGKVHLIRGMLALLSVVFSYAVSGHSISNFFIE